jgi:hypothetical protein
VNKGIGYSVLLIWQKEKQKKKKAIASLDIFIVKS